MWRVLFFFLFIVVFVGGGYIFYQGYYINKLTTQKSILSVNTPYSDAGVFVDGEYMGPTPFYLDDLTPGEHSLKVGDWVNKVILTESALTAVNQDLGPGEFSGGDVIWVEKNEGEASLVIISNPDGAKISVDGKPRGETPLNIGGLTPGEHIVDIEKEHYISRKIKPVLEPGFKLNINSTLMLDPLPKTIGPIEMSLENVTVLDFSTTNEELSSNISAWIKGLVFYFRSYGLSSQNRVDFYLDSSGNFYDATGVALSVENYPEVGKNIISIGYLGYKIENGFSPQSLDTLNTLVGEEGLPVIVGDATQIEVLQTGTGWLRVRSGPGLGNDEIVKINVGETYEVVAEENGWFQIKLDSATIGWVSNQFVRKIDAPATIQ